VSRLPERIFVVDDEPSVRKGLWRVLRSAGFEVATFESSEEFLSRLPPDSPGCVILDVSMPGRDGLALQGELDSRGSTLPIVFLTGHGDIPKSVQAMKRGAVDFLTKPVEEEVLVRAVHQALEKDREKRRARAEAADAQARLETLTLREREVLEGVVAGKLNKQIGGDLGIAEKTVKVHRGRVMEKMGAGSLAELVRIAQRVGILSG